MDWQRRGDGVWLRFSTRCIDTNVLKRRLGFLLCDYGIAALLGVG